MLIGLVLLIVFILGFMLILRCLFVSFCDLLFLIIVLVNLFLLFFGEFRGRYFFTLFGDKFLIFLIFLILGLLRLLKENCFFFEFFDGVV